MRWSPLNTNEIVESRVVRKKASRQQVRISSYGHCVKDTGIVLNIS